MLAMGGQLAAARTDDAHSALREQLKVVPGRGVAVHAVVHRGRDQDRAGGRQRRRGHEAVGVTMGQLGDRVGRGRRDQVGVAFCTSARWLIGARSG